MPKNPLHGLLYGTDTRKPLTVSEHVKIRRQAPHIFDFALSVASKESPNILLG